MSPRRFQEDLPVDAVELTLNYNLKGFFEFFEEPQDLCFYGTWRALQNVSIVRQERDKRIYDFDTHNQN